MFLLWNFYYPKVVITASLGFYHLSFSSSHFSTYNYLLQTLRLIITNLIMGPKAFSFCMITQTCQPGPMWIGSGFPTGLALISSGVARKDHFGCWLGVPVSMLFTRSNTGFKVTSNAIYGLEQSIWNDLGRTGIGVRRPFLSACTSDYSKIYLNWGGYICGWIIKLKH